MSRRIYIFVTLSIIVVAIIFVLKNIDIVYARYSPVSVLQNLDKNSDVKKITSAPVRLVIPKLKVDASVQGIGVTNQGIMDSPKEPTEVGWFSLGIRPGEIGSAVIDGHSGWKNNIPAVFDELYKLKKGDKVYIQDDKGIMITFTVRELRTYKPNQQSDGIFDSSDGKAHLNLITCTGFWNKILKGHSDRLVVFTEIDLTK